MARSRATRPGSVRSVRLRRASAVAVRVPLIMGVPQRKMWVAARVCGRDAVCTKSEAPGFYKTDAFLTVHRPEVACTPGMASALTDPITRGGHARRTGYLRAVYCKE